MQTAKQLAEQLQLQPHPEGGYYKEVYRSEGTITLPGFIGGRNYCTSIYFMLTGDNFSAFHRIKSDELWHFYTGDVCEVVVIHLSGELEIIKLGSDIGNGETFQAVVPAGAWFASRCTNVNGFSLVGCTVSPGFDFTDFEMAQRDTLTSEYPQHSEIIKQLTRE